MSKETYLDKLAEIKKTMDAQTQRVRWHDEDVMQLLMTGKADNHPPKSCKSMLSKLRNNDATRRIFRVIIQRYESETGKKLKPNVIKTTDLTHDQIEKIKNHIVPTGLDKTFCSAWLHNHGFSNGKWTPWEYETEHSKHKQETKTVEVVKEANPPSNSELELNLKAVKTLSESGMSWKQIATVIGKDENLVVALLKVCEAF